MKCCWGCSTLLPEDLIEYIPNGMTYSYPGTLPGDVVLVAGIDSLKRSWGELSKLEVAVIVFDARVNLRQWSIREIELDTRAMRRMLAEQNTIRFVNRNPIRRILRKLQSSFVGNFITLSYKTRDLEKQQELRRTVFQHIYQGRRIALIATINKKSLDMIAMLNSPECERLESALQDIRGGTSVRVAGKKHGVAAFDLEYVLRAVK